MSFLSRAKAKFKRSLGDQKSEQQKNQIPSEPFQLEQEQDYHGHTCKCFPCVNYRIQHRLYAHLPLDTDMYTAAGADFLRDKECC